MAITYRATGVYDTSTTGTAITPVKPSGLAIGDLMICELRWYGTSVISSVPTTTGGWTLIRQQNSGYSTAWYIKVANRLDVAATNWSWAITTGVTKRTGRVHAFYGEYNKVTPLLQAGTYYFGSTGAVTIDCPTITTSRANSIVFAGVGGYLTSTHTHTEPTSPGAWTQDYDAWNTTADFGHGLAHYIYPNSATSTGTVAYPVLTSTPTNRTGILFEIDPTNSVAIDNVTASDGTPTVALQRGVDVTDNATASDTQGVAEQLALGLSDNVTAADPRTVERMDAVADLSVNVTDNVLVRDRLWPSPAEFIIVSDSVSVGVNWNVAVSDNATAADSVALLNPSVAVSDNVRASDSVAQAVQYAVDKTDNVTASDSASVDPLRITVADNATASDTQTVARQLAVSVSDNVTASDTAAAAPWWVLSVQDSATASDTGGASLGAVLPREVNLTDNVTARDYLGPSPAEFITASDSVSVTISGAQGAVNLSDSVTASDSAAVQLPVLVLSVLDNATAADTPSVARGAVTPNSVTAADNATASDTVGVNVTPLRTSVTDNVVASDSASVSRGALAPLSVDVTDRVTARDYFGPPAAEFVVVSDSVSVSVPLVVTVSDGVSARDRLWPPAAEFIVVSDSVSVSIGAPSSLVVSVTDRVVTDEIIGRGPGDVVTASDSVTVYITGAPASVSVTDRVATSDSGAAAIRLAAVVTDHVAVSDPTSAQRDQLNVSSLDTVVAYDDRILLMSQAPGAVNVIDFAVASDSTVLQVLPLRLDVTDSVVVDDVARPLPDAMVDLLDAIAVSDHAELAPDEELSVTDFAVASDSTEGMLDAHNLDVSDVATLRDRARAWLTRKYFRHLHGRTGTAPTLDGTAQSSTSLGGNGTLDTELDGEGTMET